MKYIIPMVLLILQACTWVELTPRGEQVQILDMAAAAQCSKSGQTYVSVRIEAGGFEQKEERINEQLEFLARNEAGETGNAIVMVSESMEGMSRVREYIIYHC